MKSFIELPHNFTEQVDTIVAAVKESTSKEITRPEWNRNWRTAVKFCVRTLNHEGVKCEFYEVNEQWGIKILE